MNIISLKCANCGAGLDITNETDTITCSYCGTRQLVERSGGNVSLQKIEEALDEVKTGTNRAASELALARLQSDISAICAQRDTALGALRAADERSNVVIGWTLIVGVIAAITLFGWWSIPVIAAGLFIGSRFVTSVSDKVKTVIANAEARIEPLQAEIARHQSIIDLYDFSSPGKK